MASVENINDLEGEALASAVAELAEQLLTEINSSTDPEAIRSAGDRAQDLERRVPAGTKGAATARMRIDNTVAAADSRAREVEANEDGGSALSMSGPRSPASRAFQEKMFSFMNNQERQFFNSLEDNKQYKMASIDKDGNVNETDRTVDGAQLKEDFARVKYNALSEEQRSGIALPDGTYEGKLSPEDAKGLSPEQAAKKLSEQEIQKLDKLEESLNNLEGYKAQKMMERDASPEECKHCHQQFENARTQVRGIKDRIERAQDLRENGRDAEANMEKAMIQVDKGRLRQTLQKDVIDDALLDNGKQSDSLRISGGQHFDRSESAQLVAGNAKISEDARRQNSSLTV